MEITIVLEPVKDGGFSVEVPTLSGCLSYGKTKEEALKNIRDAIALYLEPDAEDLKDLNPGSILEKITM